MRRANRQSRRQASLVVVALVAFASSGSARADLTGGRYALVIGNSDYGGREEVSGVKDASGMYDYLRQMKFNVLPPVYDGTLDDMKIALANLSQQISKASVVIFFYSGHGFQLNQTDYLQPIGAAASAGQALSLNAVLLALTAAPQDAVKLVFLDACRTNLGLAPELAQGMTLPPPKESPVRPIHTMIGFAAQYDNVAASGSKDGRSPYSNALLLSIREPGLEIGEFMKRVHADVEQHSDGQSPIEDGYDSIPQNFYLQEPVFVNPTTRCVDDNLIVLLNGRVAYNAPATSTPAPLRLRAGDNRLELLVYNQKTYRNGNGLERPEGWKYWLQLKDKNGVDIPCPEADPGTPCLAASEDVPLKDGPHHGQLFTVARATLRLDPASGGLSLVNRDVNVWESEAPLEARDQTVLDQVSLPFLPLVLRVRGNRIATAAAQSCMGEEMGHLLTDLGSIALSAANGDPTPINGLAQTLEQCIKTKLGTDLRVSVTVENPAEDTAPPRVNDPCS